MNTSFNRVASQPGAGPPFCLLLAVAVLVHWLVAPAGARAGGPEPWVDAALPVKAGLSLWLDAPRQPAAWRAAGKPALVDGNLLDVWYDGSGNGRHLSQAVKAAQPKFAAGERAAVVRFDGENDFLGRAG